MIPKALSHTSTLHSKLRGVTTRKTQLLGKCFLIPISKQISSPTKQPSLSQWQTLTCGEGNKQPAIPRAQLLSAMAMQAIPLKNPGRADRSWEDQVGKHWLTLAMCLQPRAAMQTCPQCPSEPSAGCWACPSPCNMRHSKTSLSAGWQAASFGWHERNYLDPPRLPGSTRVAKATCDWVQTTDKKPLPALPGWPAKLTSAMQLPVRDT